MTEEQYIELCHECDKLIGSDNSEPERVAISWLHIIREHPVFLRRYSFLFSGEGVLKRKIRHLKTRIFQALVFARQIGRAMIDSSHSWSASSQIPANVDYIFVSHLVNISHAGLSEDFYFGDIPIELEKKGYKVVVVLQNYSNLDSKELSKKWKGDNVPRVVLSKTLNLKSEIKLRKLLAQQKRMLRRCAKYQKKKLMRDIYAQAGYEALSNASINALRFHYQIKNLIRNHKSNAIITTYEGHNWERLAFAAARGEQKKTRCIGYQHAALFKMQHAVRKSLGSIYDPDYILTTGEFPRREFQKAVGTRDIPTYVLGTHRVLSDSIVSVGNIGSNRRNQACLVIPEGIESESAMLFDITLQCAKDNPDLQFIWRLHPLIDFKKLAKKYTYLSKLPSNIKVSKSSLEDDIRNSAWVVYRGSTAVIQSIMGGLRPLYYRPGEEMSVDPLYALSEWKRTFDSLESLAKTIHEDIDAEIQDNNSLENAINYCNALFQPIRDREIVELFSK